MPAADKVDQLKAVSFGQRGFGPTSTWNDFAIMFDGDAIGLQPQLTDEILKAGRLGERGKAAGLAIQDNRKRHI